MKNDDYTPDEVKEIISYLGTELRLGDISEAYFRIRLANLGYNASDIDEIINQETRPT